MCLEAAVCGSSQVFSLQSKGLWDLGLQRAFVYMGSELLAFTILGSKI